MKNKMKKFIYILLLLPLGIFSQEKDKTTKVKLEEKQFLRKGNDFYKQKKFVDAEVKYIKALKQNPNYETAGYNLANSIYEQNRYKDALPGYELVTKTTKDKVTKSQSFHNMGNTLIKQKQYDKSILAFKNSLRLNPKDDETRYNLALAQKLLDDQQQKNKDNKDNKDKNKDKDKDKNQDKDQKQDQGDDDKDKNKDQGNDDKDKQDQDKRGDNEQNNKQQPKPQPNKLSQQQIQQLLDAMNNEENKTQQKVNARKARGKKVKQEKDW